MISAHDIARWQGAPDHIAMAPARAPALPLTERILLVTLFIAMLLSSVAFFEPSPHDGFMGVLVFACLLAGVRFERAAAAPLLMLLIWNVAGLIALLNAFSNDKAIQYSVTSVYLSIAAVLFTCLFAQGNAQRLAAMRTGYIASAVVASLAGMAGYFHLFPGSSMFELHGRAMGMFKDPNVFGPYLIWPALFVMTRLMTSRIALRDLLIAGILLAGILLSFSRGAWMHFLLSAVSMIVLLILTAPTSGARFRLVLLSIGVAAAAALCFVLLLSIDSVREMFAARAQVIQSYDVGQGGRFQLQEIALSALLDFPLGMGPLEFARVYGLQQHNVYLQAFLVYGWIGGLAYLLLLITTLMIGFRAVLVATPWQPYLLTAYATFIGEIGEGSIIDTDHWRHFFLLLGMIWGLSAATIKARRNQAAGLSPNPRPLSV